MCNTLQAWWTETSAMADIIRWHHLKKMFFFFHLLAIRGSAKAVFCDRRHLLKFSLQQDLWTKIITNFVFQSFRLCSRTALQVLSTDYTVTIVAEKLERGGFCFCLGWSVYSSTSNVDLNNHTGHIYRTRCTDMQKNISTQVQTLQQGLQSKVVFD